METGREPNGRFLKGSKHPDWKGGRSKNQGYIFVYAPESFSCKVRGKTSIAEHILVVESRLRRRLKDGEHIHHINGIRDDNRIENLQILTKEIHFKIHKLKKTVKDKNRILKIVLSEFLEKEQYI
jgi:HNH endonuclease